MKIYSIYKHTNKTNGKTYIGVTSQKPKQRWNNGKGYYNNSEFFEDIILFGWQEGFTHEILAKTTNKETANLLEKTYIEIYQKLGVSYNLESGGFSGYKVAASTREKLRKANLGEKSINRRNKRYSIIDKYYNRNKSVKENLEILSNEGINICYRTLYNYINNRFPKSSSSSRNDLVLKLFDHNKTIKQNLELLKSNNIFISRATLYRIINKNVA